MKIWVSVCITLIVVGILGMGVALVLEVKATTNQEYILYCVETCGICEAEITTGNRRICKCHCKKGGF